MPTRLPAASTRAPPELPGLIAAAGMPPERAHDAGGDGLADGEGVADRQDHVADPQGAGIAECDRRQVGEVKFEHREVRIRVFADDLRARLAAVGQGDVDFGGTVDDVVVGDDVALGTDDHAGTQIGHALGLRLLAAEKVAEHRVIHVRMSLPLDLFRGEDVDDGRHGALGRVGERCVFNPRARQGRLANGHDIGAQEAGGARQQVGTQRVDHEQDRQRNRHGLRKNLPEAAHRRGEEMKGRGR